MKIASVNTLELGRPQYRLGDAVFLRNTPCGRQALKQAASDQSSFKGTVLYEYEANIDQNCYEPQWEVLKKVVSKKSQEIKLELPRENELVIHIRMGDIKGFKLSAEKFVEYTIDVINCIETPISEITIVTAIHFGRSLLESQMTKEQVAIATSKDIGKIRKILNLFSESKLRARLYSHKEIDIDFCFLANSKYFVLGNGHFSICAAMVSSAECFIPPWAKTGCEANIEELLNSRNDFPGYF